MSALTRSIDSEPHDDGSLNKTWTVSSDTGSIALSLIRCDELKVVLPTSARQYVAAADNGQAWVFGAIRTHEATDEPVFGCRQHERCEMDTIVSSYARPAWQRIAAAGVTDEAVFAELEAIHRVHFPAEGEAA